MEGPAARCGLVPRKELAAARMPLPGATIIDLHRSFESASACGRVRSTLTAPSKANVYRMGCLSAHRRTIDFAVTGFAAQPSLCRSACSKPAPHNVTLVGSTGAATPPHAPQSGNRLQFHGLPPRKLGKMYRGNQVLSAVMTAMLHASGSQVVQLRRRTVSASDRRYVRKRPRRSCLTSRADQNPLCITTDSAIFGCVICMSLHYLVTPLRGCRTDSSCLTGSYLCSVADGRYSRERRAASWSGKRCTAAQRSRTFPWRRSRRGNTENILAQMGREGALGRIRLAV